MQEEKNENQKENCGIMSFIQPKQLSCFVCKGIMHNPMSVLPCRHTFCAGCITKWFRNSGTCPRNRVCNSKALDLRTNCELKKVVESFLKENSQFVRSEGDKFLLDENELEYLKKSFIENRIRMELLADSCEIPDIDKMRNYAERDRRWSKRLIELTTERFEKLNGDKSLVHSQNVVSFENSLGTLYARCYPVSGRSKHASSYSLSDKLLDKIQLACPSISGSFLACFGLNDNFLLLFQERSIIFFTRHPLYKASLLFRELKWENSSSK